MIEIGPNFKELLSYIVDAIIVIALFLGPLYFLYSVEKLSSENKKTQDKKTFFSMDNPIIYLIISVLVILILVYVFKIR